MMPNARLRAKTLNTGPVRAALSVLSGLRFAALAAGLVALMPGSGVAQQTEAVTTESPTERVVLLELYTAQGCASCPPADEMMLELADRDDVIALSLHVDYWDYIGWADSFADPEHAQRQQRYARRHGHSTIYTPQVVINGIEIIEGFRVMQVMETIAAQRNRRPEVEMDLARIGETGLQIRARISDDVAPAMAMASRRSAMPNAVVGTLSMGDVVAEVEASAPMVASARELIGDGQYAIQVVRYRASDEVEILGGENAGLSARYANIVTDWQMVAGWDLSAPLDLTIPLEGDDPVVVIVQESGQGEIIAAARLR